MPNEIDIPTPMTKKQIAELERLAAIHPEVRDELDRYSTLRKELESNLAKLKSFETAA